MLSHFRHANCLDLVERSFAALTKVTKLSVCACAKLHWGRSVFYRPKKIDNTLSEEIKLWQQLIASSHSWVLARSRLDQSIIPSSKTRKAKKSSTGHSQNRFDQHLRERPAYLSRPLRGSRENDHGARDDGRSHRTRSRRRVYQAGRSLFGSFQCCLRALPQLQGEAHQRMHECQR